MVHIPKSWLGPHMVTFKNYSRFYSRTSAGKQQLDVSELRSAFALSQGVAERVRAFRDERLARLVAGDTPVALGPERPLLVLHMIPLWPPEASNEIDLASLENSQVRPITRSSGWDHRFNFDGSLTSSGRDPSRSYVQVFRHGAIEAVDNFKLRQQAETPAFGGYAFCKLLLKTVPEYLAAQESLAVAPPIAVLITLLSVKGFRVMAGDTMDDVSPIDRDNLLLPDVLVADFSDFDSQTLRPAFDALFQSSGFPRCLGYDETGRWLLPGG